MSTYAEPGAHLGEHVDGRVAVLVDDRDEQVGDEPASVVGELAAASEVGERDPAVVHREQVPGVRVAVVEAEHEDLLVVAGDASAGDLVSVHALRVELLRPVERHASDSLERQYRRRSALPVDLREVDGGIVGEQCREALGVLALEHVVALLVQHAGELVDESDDVVAAPEVGAPVEPAPCVRRMSRSASMTSRMPGRWTLTATSVPSSSFAKWTCPIVAAAAGVSRELGEQLVERLAECRLDLRLHLIEAERLHLVLQLREFGGVGGRDDVGADREHLPDLRERRPEPLHGAA